MAGVSRHFPLSHGVLRVDDRRVVSGIIHVVLNGLQWKDATKRYGPHKTVYNSGMWWSRLWVFDRIFVSLVGEGARPERIVIDATHLKAHTCSDRSTRRSAAIMGVLFIVQIYTGLQLPWVTPDTITTIIGLITPVLVWAVPNKKVP